MQPKSIQETTTRNNLVILPEVIPVRQYFSRYGLCSNHYQTSAFSGGFNSYSFITHCAQCHDSISSVVDDDVIRCDYYLDIIVSKLNFTKIGYKDDYKAIAKRAAEIIADLIINCKEFSGFNTTPIVELIDLGENYHLRINFLKATDWIDIRTKRYLILKLIRGSLIFMTSDIKEIIDSYFSKYYRDEIWLQNKFLSGSEMFTKIYKYYSKIASNNIRTDQFIGDLSAVFDAVLNIEKEEREKIKREHPLLVWSKHPSHSPLREMKTAAKAIIRFGFTLKPRDESKYRDHIIINREGAIANSASKFLMKHNFEENKVKTADWCIPDNQEELQEFISKFKEGTKFIVKSEYGSRGDGLLLFQTPEEMTTWFNSPYKTIKKQKWGNYLVEKYYNYDREYRLHVTKDGCFYTCRKMLKADATERWFRNDSNSVWIVEENEQFAKPVNWKQIEAECVKALNSVGLDVGACDVRVQSARDNKNRLRENCDFIICEINSAPGLGEVGLEHYKAAIHKIIENKTT